MDHQDEHIEQMQAVIDVLQAQLNAAIVATVNAQARLRVLEKRASTKTPPDLHAVEQ